MGKEIASEKRQAKPPLEKPAFKPEALLREQTRIEGFEKHDGRQSPTIMEELDQVNDSPFIEEVMRFRHPQAFKIPGFETFDGSTNPVDHLGMYMSLMHLQAMPDEIMCQAFPITLKGGARAWFNELPQNSIKNFKELSDIFVSYFTTGQRYGKPSTQLIAIKQSNTESLRDYITRFIRELDKIDDMEDNVPITTYTAGLRPSPFFYLLSQEPPQTIAELRQRARKYVDAEEASEAKYPDDCQIGSSQVGRKRKNPSRRAKSSPKRIKARTSPRKGGGPPEGKYKYLTPLIATPGHILHDLRDDSDLEWPEKL